MPVSISLSGGNLTLTFEFTGPQDELQPIADDFALELFNRRFPSDMFADEEDQPVFGELTNQEKANMIYKYFKRVAVDMANQGALNKVVMAAKDEYTPHIEIQD